MIGNLNNYVIFHTVAKAGNISKAAELLEISRQRLYNKLKK